MNVHWSMTIPKNTLSLFLFGILAALSTLQTRQCKISKKKNLKLHVFLHSNQPKNQEAQQHYQINFLKIKASCLILRLFLQMDFRLKKSGEPPISPALFCCRDQGILGFQDIGFFQPEKSMSWMILLVGQPFCGAVSGGVKSSRASSIDWRLMPKTHLKDFTEILV